MARCAVGKGSAEFAPFSVEGAGPSRVRRRRQHHNDPQTMRLTTFSAYVATLALSLAVSAAAQTPPAARVCADVPDRFACLLKKFSAVYREAEDHNDFTLYWAIIHTEADRAKACTGDAPARFLRLHRVVAGNADTTEFISQVTEDLFLKNPRCVLSASTRLGSKDRAAVVESLQRPLFHELSEIDATFRKFRDDQRYRIVTDLYYSRKGAL